MKRQRKNEVRQDIQPVTAPKAESDINQNIADAVNDWITESRETRRAEKAFFRRKNIGVEINAPVHKL